MPLSTRPWPFLQDRAVMSNKEWRHQIQEVDTEVYRTLRNGITGGFDEEKFGNRIGFGNLKGYPTPPPTHTHILQI